MLSDETNDASTLLIKLQNFDPLEQIHHKVDYVSNYFSTLTPPSLPQINLFNFGWLFSPLFSFGALFRDFFTPKPKDVNNLKLALDDDKFQLLLKHIDNYVDSTIEQKFNIVNNVMKKDVNDRLIVIIQNQIRDALNENANRLSAKDLEIITNQIKVQLNEDFNEREKSILAKISLSNEENVERIKMGVLDSTAHDGIFLGNQKIDLDKIILMILESDKISSILRAINGQLDIHDMDIADLKRDIGQMRLEIIDKFSDFDGKLQSLELKGTSISDDLIKFKKENDETIRNILLKIDDKFATFSDFSSIDVSVRKSLFNILGFNSGTEFSDENLLKQWIDNTFVAKSYLEDHLHKLELRLNDAFLKALDKNAGILMEDINEKLKSQIKLSIEQNQFSAKVGGSGALSEEDIIKIVKDILAIYDADKTGLVDFALESAGGEVISTRCTENYRVKSAEISIFGIPIWYPNNTPRTVISPTIAPGECWAFQGFPGYLVIKLNNLIKVTGFTIEHIPQANAPNRNIDSAPNNFTVWVGHSNAF